MKALILVLIGSFSAWADNVVEFEVRGTTVNGYVCDESGKTAAASAVSSDVLTQAQSVRPNAYLISKGAQCTSVSAPAAPADTPSPAPDTAAPVTAAPATAAPATAAPATAAPATAAPFFERRIYEEVATVVQHRRTGPVKMLAWATVGVPVSSAADAASLTPAMFVPATAGATWNPTPGKYTQISSATDPKCTFATTTGYTATACVGSVTAADCDVACAVNFSLPLTTPPTFLTKSCTANGGVFQLRGCYPTGCKLGGETCTASTECCQYSTPTLSLDKRQNACAAGSKAKGKVKGKGKSKGKAATSTCASLSIPKLGKANSKAKKAKTIGAAVGVGVGVSALGLAAVAFRRRNRKTRATAPPSNGPSTVGMMTVRV